MNTMGMHLHGMCPPMYQAWSLSVMLPFVMWAQGACAYNVLVAFHLHACILDMNALCASICNICIQGCGLCAACGLVRMLCGSMDHANVKCVHVGNAHVRCLYILQMDACMNSVHMLIVSCYVSSPLA